MDFKSLEDIFQDEEFDKLVESAKPKKIERVDPDIEKFQEIIHWIKEHGDEPQKSRDLKERKLASRLKGLRDRTAEDLKKYFPYDKEYHLLGANRAEQALEEALFDVSRYADTIAEKDRGLSTRKMIRTGFEHYKNLFTKVHQEIEAGQRKTKPFRGNKIVQGNFYIDNGILLYVNKIYDPKTGVEVTNSDNRRYKVHTIYENGTENHIWLLSLVSSLYDTKRNGRLVKGIIPEVPGIYIVRYAGEDDYLRKMENLYKIGCAENIRRRLQGTEKQSTYLYAPIDLVSYIEVSHSLVAKVETYLHHCLADKRLEISILSPSGEETTVREWFLVSLEEIERSLEILKNMML
ncbi:GIY-YIG nuclease family protein [Streptococcus pneumoniae]